MMARVFVSLVSGVAERHVGVPRTWMFRIDAPKRRSESRR